MLEKQEIYCHDCKNYVQFDIDTELNGNHVLTCPTCKHEHCRVVTDGIITDARWDQRNGVWTTPTYANSTIYTASIGQTYSAFNVTMSTSSTYDSYMSSSSTDTTTGFIYNSWMNTGRYGT
jgi:uncharacterized protein YbaR (Trm112 family)